MKVFVILAIVCSLWSASALPKHPKIDDTCKVTIDNIVYEPTTPQIIVTFTPGPTCTITPIYKIRSKIGGESADHNAIAGMNMGIVPLNNEITCEDVDITVVSFEGEDEVVSDSKSFVRNFPAIINPVVEQTETTLEISYDKIDKDYESCAAFKVSVSAESGEIVSTAECTNGLCSIPLEGLAFETCTSYTAKISIEVNDENVDITPSTIEHQFTYKLQGVSEVTGVPKDNEIEIIFSPLDATISTENCGAIKYKIAEKEGSCFKSTYTVYPVYGEENDEGQGKSATIQKKPSAVEDLTGEISGSTALLKWNRPTGSELCDLAYKVMLEETEIINNIHTTSQAISINEHAIENCQHKSVSIFTQIKLENGEYSDGYVAKIDIPGAVGQVKDLACSHAADTVTCAWEKPADCDENAVLQYNLMYYDGTNVHNQKIMDNQFEFGMNCPTSSIFSVTPIFKNIGVGEISEVTVEGC